METANHSLEMEKCQIAISSSSERDKGTFPLSPEREGILTDQQVLSLSSRETVTDICSESPACKGETIADQPPY